MSLSDLRYSLTPLKVTHYHCYVVVNNRWLYPQFENNGLYQHIKRKDGTN